MMLGYWPLMTVSEARSKAMEVLRQCRDGEQPGCKVKPKLPTLREALIDYCAAKTIKASSQKRYDSIFRTHFAVWLDCKVSDLGFASFAEHCHAFGQTKGAALVEVGRGLIGALVKYINADHGLTLESPFNKLAAAGLLPQKSKPRARVLQDSDLPAWKLAFGKLGQRQQDFVYLALYLHHHIPTSLRQSQWVNSSEHGWGNFCERQRSSTDFINI